MKFSQGRDDVAQEKETVLKKLFLNSMKNTERRLIQIGNQNTINRMSQYISQVTKNNEEKDGLNLRYVYIDRCSNVSSKSMSSQHTYLCVQHAL